MKILLLAGEESGEIYAGGIRRRLSGHEVRGYGDYGFAVSDLAVFGFAAVLRKIFFFMRVKRTMERAIDEWRPDAVCTVDYPGMNLKLAAYAKRRGIRAVHVVCPQVWAWRRGRIPAIEAALDRLCCFFPFEPGLFRPGFATFVGHPLAAELAQDGATRRGGRQDRPLVALLPGSRTGEISRILPTLLKAADMVPEAEFAVPAANDAAFALIERIVRKSGCKAAVRVERGGARDVLRAAACAAVASGTATLEATLCGCPTVLVYRVNPLLAAFARRVIDGTKYIGLANIVWERCGGSEKEPPMPELLQENFTAAAVSGVLKGWVSDPAARTAAAGRLASVKALLGSGVDALDAVVRELGPADRGQP